MQPVQDLTIDSSVSRSQYQFALQDANPDEFAVWVPKLLDPAAATAAARGCRQHLFRKRALGLRADRPRHRGALRHHPGDDRQRALRFVRPAHRVDDLHPVEPVPGDPRSRPQSAAIAVLARRDLPAVLDRGRRAGAAVGGRQGLRADGTPGDQPSRPVSLDDDLVQPGARLFARRGGRGDQGGRARDRPAGQHDHASFRVRHWRFRRRSATS